jgi:hypothetical protein
LRRFDFSLSLQRVEAMAEQAQKSVGEQIASDVAESRALSTDVRAAQGILAEMTGGSSIPALHNFTGNGIEQWRMTAIARGPSCGGIDDVDGKELSLVHFYVHPVSMPGDAPGEIIDGVRCVLFDKDKNAFAFVSQGIAESLATILQHCGMGPYDPPLMVRIIKSTTHRGRKIFSIVPA